MAWHTFTLTATTWADPTPFTLNSAPLALPHEVPLKADAHEAPVMAVQDTAADEIDESHPASIAGTGCGDQQPRAGPT